MKSLSTKTFQCGITVQGLTTLAGTTYLTGITNTASWDHVIVGTTAQGQIYTRTYAQFMTDVATGIGLSGYVPTSRTLTINGTTYDLSANRTWTISNVETDTLDSVTTRGNVTANTIDVGGVTSNYFLVDTTATPTLAPGMFAWNDTDGTVDLRLKGNNVTLQLGQENVVRVVNKTGANLLESQYKVVRVRTQAEGGAQGQRLAILLAQANTKANHTGILGIVTENINNNQEGFVTAFGEVKNINTTGSLQSETWLDGDALWLSDSVAGGLTKVEPTIHPVQIGYVLYAHSNNGKIFVRVNEGVDELNELHDVTITSATTGQLLQYNSGTWVNWSPNYLTAESDTLATVTGRGATTNTSITVGPDLIVQADGSVNYTASRLWLNSHNNYRGAGVHMSGVGSTWFAGTPYTDFDGGYVIARTSTSNDVSSAQYSNALLTVKSTGHVGIGTVTPDSKLHIEGNTTGLGSGADAIVHIKQNGGWNANEPWALYVEGYSYLNGFRVNAYDTQRSLFSSAGELGFAVSGNSPISFTQNTSDYRMYIASGGQVIVGGTTVGYSGTKLQVGNTSDSQNGLNILTSTTGYGYILFGDGAGADTYVGQIWYYHGDNYMGFQTNGSERMRITAAGNVGIGTSSPSSPGGFTKIVHISGGYASLVLTSTNVSKTWEIGINSSSLLTFYDGSADRMVINASGNVGIGTTSPASLLHINGTGNTFTRYTNTTNSGHYIDIGANGAGESFVYGYGAYPLLFGTNGSERMRITPAGNILVGTTTDAGYKLDVNGTARVNDRAYIGEDVTFTSSQYYYAISASSDGLLTFTNNTVTQGNAQGFLSGELYLAGSAAFLNHRAINIITTNRNTNTSNIVRAFYASGRTGNSGAANTVAGFLGGVNIEGSGNVTNAIGLEVEILSQTNNKTITNMYGVKVQPLVNSVGTITNTYGVYIDSLTAGTQTNAAYGIYQAGTDKNYFGGNVGIGTTNPGYKLQVNADGAGLYVLGANTAPYTQTIASFVYGGNGNSINIENQGGKASIQARAGSSSMDLILNAAGSNVGIGTASPAQKLDVAGGDIILSSNATYIRSKDASGNTPRMFGINSSNDTYIGPIDSYAGGAVLYGVSANVSFQTFYTGASARVHINSSGNVGIGTTSPESKLHVSVGSIFIDNNFSYRQKTSSGGNVGLIYIDSSNLMGIYDGKVNVTSAGNVGIGTTSPSKKLQIGISNATHADEGILLQSPAGYGEGAIYHDYGQSTGVTAFKILNTYSGSQIALSQDTYSSTGSPGSIRLYTAASGGSNTPVERMRITSAGDVGIGTASPAATLHTVGSGIVNIVQSSNTVSYTQYYNTSTGTNTSNDGLTVGINGLDAYVLHREAGNLILGTLDTERVRITSAGLVGIGTSSPSVKLDVIGSIRSEIAADGNFLTLQATGQRVHYIKRSGQILQFTSDGANTYDVRFDSSNGSAYFATGNVGIGTVSPSTKLDVAGVITATGGNSTNWNTAFSWGNHSSAGYVPQARTLTINGTSYDLSANRSWTIATTTPGGSNTQFQYNSSGTLAGASALTYDSGTNRVGINQASPGYDLDVNGQVRVQDKLRVGTVNSGNGVVHMSSTATINPSATTIVWSQNVSVGMCAFIEYYILNNNTTTDQRAGTIMVTWNQSGTPTIAHTETTTPDIGSTIAVNFTSSLVGSDARINAVNSSSAPYTIVMSYKYF
jgi:hypothetical protein